MSEQYGLDELSSEYETAPVPLLVAESATEVLNATADPGEVLIEIVCGARVI